MSIKEMQKDSDYQQIKRSMVKAVEAHYRLTCNTNSYFDIDIAKALATDLDLYKFTQFVRLLGMADTIRNIKSHGKSIR